MLYSPEGNNPVSFNVDKANVTVNEKNGVPTVEKKIIEESEPVDKNSANIGDTVTYKTTITVAAGAKDYVLHDKMEAGLTFDLAKGVTGVGLISNGGTETTVDAGNYTVSKGTETTDACTFHVAFDQSWVETLHAGDKIVVHYEAVVNENATTGTDTNDNDTWLKYGQNSNTTHDKTETATYKIQIVKTDGGTSEGTEYKVLDGAQFELYRGSKEEANRISFIKTGSDYHVAQAGESGSTTVIEAGTPIIKGLEEGSYVLVETKAPDGYNKAADTTFTVNADNVVMNGTVRDNIFTPANGDTEGIHVINHDGSSLPSTGGMGTTILYIAGVILILGAGSALVLMNRKSSRRKKTRR